MKRIKKSVKLKIEKKKRFQKEPFRVLVLSNGFFMFSRYAKAFMEYGYEVSVFTFRRYDNLVPNYYRSLTEAVDKVSPDFIFTINYIGFDDNGSLSAMFNLLEIPVFCYLIDHPSIILRKNEKNINDNVHLFVMDTNWIKNCSLVYNKIPVYLPIALNEEVLKFKFRKMDEKIPLSYYGKTFLEFIDEYSDDTFINEGLDVTETMNKILHAQLKEPAKITLDVINDFEKDEKINLEFDTEVSRHRFMLKVMMITDLYYRRYILTNLLGKKILITGDIKWSKLFPEYELCLDIIKTHSDLLNLYYNSIITLSPMSVMLPNSPNQKILEAPFCDCFVLADYKKDIADMFKDVGFGYFDSIQNMENRAEYYLANERERKKINKGMRETILQNHRYIHRINIIDGYIKAVLV